MPCRPASTLLLVALVLLGTGPAACSSGETEVTPEAFAAEVCAAVASWQEDLAGRAADLDRRAEATTDARGWRDALLGFLTGVSERTERLRRDVGAAGTPSGEGGGAVAGEVHRRVEDARRLLDTARGDAERLPEDDAGGVARGAEGIVRTVDEGRDRIGAPLEGPPDSPALVALREEPACRALGG